MSLVSISIAHVNKHFVCPLCEGYFRDPYTISQCGETFCKACLFMKLDVKTYRVCPSPHCPCKDAELQVQGSDFAGESIPPPTLELFLSSQLFNSSCPLTPPLEHPSGIDADHAKRALLDLFFPEWRLQNSANREQFYQDREIPKKQENEDDGEEQEDGNSSHNGREKEPPSSSSPSSSSSSASSDNDNDTGNEREEEPKLVLKLGGKRPLSLISSAVTESDGSLKVVVKAIADSSVPLDNKLPQVHAVLSSILPS